MKIARPASLQSPTPATSSRAGRRLRITALAVLASLACSGATSCTTQEVVLSGAAMAAVVAGTAVGITLAVQNQHHTVQGCVYSDAEGFKLHTNDAKIYTLEGDPAALKVGDRVKFHGTKVKKIKGNNTSHEVFVVEKLKKDYGPCPANLAMSTASAR